MEFREWLCKNKGELVSEFLVDRASEFMDFAEERYKEVA